MWSHRTELTPLKKEKGHSKKDQSGSSKSTALHGYQNLLIQQTSKGWFQNLCGCNAPTEIYISTMQRPDQILFHSEEESEFCTRVCCIGCHPFEYNFSIGKDGPVFTNFVRECDICACKLSTPSHGCKCCCYQHMIVADGHGKYLGRISERCYCCNPLFTVYDENDVPEYDLRMPACLFGCCPNCCETYQEQTRLKCCCFNNRAIYMYTPDEDMCVWCEGAKPVNGTDGLAKIRPIINMNTLFQNVIYGNHRYELEFPVTEGDGLSFFSEERKTNTKARLLGAAVFLNEIIKEEEEQAIQQQEKRAAKKNSGLIGDLVGNMFGGGGGRHGRGR